MNECFYLLGDFALDCAPRLSEFGLDLASVCGIPSRFEYPYRSFTVMRASSPDWAEVHYFSHPGKFPVPAEAGSWDFQTFTMKCVYASPNPARVVRELASYLRHAAVCGKLYAKGNDTSISEFVSETLARLDLDFAILGVRLPSVSSDVPRQKAGTAHR